MVPGLSLRHRKLKPISSVCGLKHLRTPGFNRACIAMANKLAGSLAIVARGEEYQLSSKPVKECIKKDRRS